MRRSMDRFNGFVVSTIFVMGVGSMACDTVDNGQSAARSLTLTAPPGLVTAVRAQLATHGITPIAAPPSASPELFALGEALFYDKLLSGGRDVSCATCHAPQLATADARPLNAGINGSGIGLANPGLIGGRHTQPLLNLHLLPGGLTIDGKIELINGEVIALGLPLVIPAEYQARMDFDIVNSQAIMPLVTQQEMRGFPDPGDDNELGDCGAGDFQCVWDGIMARIGAVPEYRDLFAAAYPSRSWSTMTIAEVGKAIGAYEYQAFFFNDSPWDRFVAGDDNALSDAALRGARFFYDPHRGNCVSCHSGNALTDEQYHKTLSPMFGPSGDGLGGNGPSGLDDFGRIRNTSDPDDKYAWRTAPLRGVELTAPYGRLGQYTTLTSFLAHYHDPEQSLIDYDITQLQLPVLHTTLLDNTAALLANGADPLLANVNVNAVAIADLVAFLSALTDDAERDMSGLIPASVPSGLFVDQ